MVEGNERMSMGERMKQVARCVGCLSVAMTLAACSMNATLVPVKGPLSERRPVPTLDVHVDGIMGGSGKLSFTAPDGDACAGRWVSLSSATVSVDSATLLTKYGPSYLPGFSIVQPGQNGGQAMATCRNGRRFDLEFVTSQGTAHGFGIGEDTEGNVYKFIF